MMSRRKDHSHHSSSSGGVRPQQTDVNNKILKELQLFRVQQTEMHNAIKSMEKEHFEAMADMQEKIDQLEKGIKSTTKQSNLTELIPMAVLQDVFDEDEIIEVVKSKMWCEVNEEVKERVIDSVKNNLIACDLDIPPDKVILKRVQSFYGNRRSTELIRCDPLKKQRRQLDSKVNRLTFVARDKAVKEAIESGEVNENDLDEISKIRKRTPKVDAATVSPYNSDEESKQQRVKKRLRSLAKAREVKRKKRQNKAQPAPSLQSEQAAGTSNTYYEAFEEGAKQYDDAVNYLGSILANDTDDDSDATRLGDYEDYDAFVRDTYDRP